ncbi:MAG TPA: hypothetical protein VHD31_00730 [Candidatus Paceibacterota bacterium]|nr:hypothetical protein [Candidatus Paceibacterota bacterium]
MHRLSLKQKTIFLWGIELAMAVALVLAITAPRAYVPNAHAQAATNAGTLTGYAWSENVGWLSFSGSNYGVTVSPTDGNTLTGYAWSENVGWVSFTSSDLSGCPSGACSARLTGTKPNVSLAGWARACASTDSGACSGAQHVGGWDGWISLSGTSPNYSPTISTYAPKPGAGGILEGYAWGSTVMGWLQFNPAFGGVTVALTACNDGLDEDGDGNPDLTDPDCVDLTTDSEGSTAVGAVDIKVNGSDSLSVRSGSSVSVTWTSALVGGCTLQSPSGTNSVAAQNTTGTPFTIAAITKFALTCTTLVGGNPTGPAISDSVTVRLIPVYKEI